jgi:hypothetical protein
MVDVPFLTFSSLTDLRHLSSQDRERIRRIEAEETKSFVKWRDILLDLGARRRKAMEMMVDADNNPIKALSFQKQSSSETKSEKEIDPKKHEIKKSDSTSSESEYVFQSGDTISLQDLLDVVDELCPSFTMRAFRYMYEAKNIKRLYIFLIRILLIAKTGDFVVVAVSQKSKCLY